MYSGISVLGRVRTQNVNGIYDATTNASFSTTVDDSLDYLSSGSTVEYNGVDNQIVSGVGLGRARYAASLRQSGNQFQRYRQYGVRISNQRSK